MGNPSATPGAARPRKRGRILLGALLVAVILPLTPGIRRRATLAAPPSSHPRRGQSRARRQRLRRGGALGRTQRGAVGRASPSRPSTRRSHRPSSLRRVASAEPASSPGSNRPATVRTAEAHGGGADVRQLDRHRERAAGQPVVRVGRLRRRRSSIQGFATDISVNRGTTVDFKIDTPSTNYHIDIYRLGYYGGDGARLVDTIPSSAITPHNQPACLFDATGNINLIDCGNWAVSASWAVPADAVSGIYIARPSRDDAGNVGKASHIVFIVRNDGGHSDILVQTSDTTWQAYNQYGGYSLYGGPGANDGGHAHKVSYNRPFTTRATPTEDWLFNAEYPMVRWLERNGYDVSYSTDLDSDRHGSEILDHKVFMSSGHDEYWSGGQRASVEAARDRGSQPRVLQRQRDLLEDALGELDRRIEHALPDARQLQGRRRAGQHRALQLLSELRLRPEFGRVDRVCGARTGRARTAGSPRTRCPARSAGATTPPPSMFPPRITRCRFWRNTGTGATTLTRRHDRVRVRLGPARVREHVPGRPDHAVRHGRVRSGTPDEPLPGAERRARVRGRHDPVVVGPRRNA